MGKNRKDPKGISLKRHESYRKTDKSYVYRYTDSLGKEHAIYRKSLMELREAEKVLQKDMLDGLDVGARNKLTLTDAFYEYMGTKTALRNRVRANYFYMYSHFVENTLGKCLVASVKYGDILKFYVGLLEKEKLQIKTLENLQTILHPTFEYALKNEIIRSNPCDGVMKELKSTHSDRPKKEALTVEQQALFLTYVERTDLDNTWKPILTVFFGTGCRVGEVTGLRWQDVDFEKKEISINHAVVYYAKGKINKGKKCFYEISLPKTQKGIRTIPMKKEVQEVLLYLHEYQQENGFSTVEIDGMSGFIFMNRFGNIHNQATINRAIKRMTEEANCEEMEKAKKEKREAVIIPHFTTHVIRHTFCTRLVEAGLNVKVIQEIMGHQDIQTTLDIYTDVSSKFERTEFDKWNDDLF